MVMTQNGTGNLEVPSAVPHKFRQRVAAYMRVLDSRWQPVMGELFDYVVGPKGGTVSSWDWPKRTDGGMMSPLSGRDENVHNISAGADMDKFNTLETKIGFIRRTDEFKEEFMDGLIAEKYKAISEDAQKAIARTIEYCTTKYLYANATIMAKFSTQTTDRLKTLDMESTDDSMTGVAWTVANRASAKPYDDVVMADTHYGDFYGGIITRGFVGNKTVAGLRLNDDLTDRQKYVKDVAGGVIATRFAGVTFKKVIGQRYKGNSDQALMLGYPGLGDLAIDTWASRNQYEMMRNDAGTKEWGILAGDGRVGFVWHTKVDNESHGDPLTTNTRVVRQDLPSIKYQVVMEKKFGPAVEDFASYMILDNTSTI